MKKERNSGVTIGILVVTVIVMLTLIGTMVVNIDIYLDTKNLVNLGNDIQILQEKLPVYYAKNNELPLYKDTDDELLSVGSIMASKINNFQNIRNANDDSNYYVINLNLMPELHLSYGYGTMSSEDYYVVNGASFAVYYLAGIVSEGNTYYTLNQNYTEIPITVNTPGSFRMVVSNVTATSIIISASPSSVENATKYRYKINNGTWIESTLPTYTFENLESGESYKISMMAVDSSGGITMASNNELEVITE